jgi:hypothetical protein
MKGHIVSRTLAEAGLTPVEGMQVMLYSTICKITEVTPTGIILDYKENSRREWDTWRLRTLMVEYEIHTPKIEGNAVRAAHIPVIEKKILPLKHSDWQSAVEQGLVDSGKEVEFEVVGKFTDSKLYPYLAATVATLIPQQDDVEKHFERIASETGDPYSRGFSDGLKAAKAEQQPITREQFMEFFRRDDFHELITPDDAHEIWHGVLHGDSDITREGIQELCENYGRSLSDVLELQQQKLYSEDEVKQLAWESYHAGRAGLQVGKAWNDWWNENKHKHETHNT